MFYVVYIDVLFLVNFFMDYIILTLTGAILRFPAGALKKCVGAASGATCYCIMLFLPAGCRLWGSAVLMLIAAGLMGRMVFSLKSPREICRFLVIFYAAAFLTGGTVTAMYYNTRLGYYIRKAVKGDEYAQIMTGVLAGMVLAACIFMKMILVCVRERQREAALYYEVTLCMSEVERTETALFDTGNHLKEPVSHKPVVIVDMTLGGELLDKKTYEAIKRFYQTGNLTEAEGIRLVPFRSVGKQNGILAAVFFDSMVIRGVQGDIRRTEVCVAISEGPVSVKGKYRVILNAELMD